MLIIGGPDGVLETSTLGLPFSAERIQEIRKWVACNDSSTAVNWEPIQGLLANIDELAKERDAMRPVVKAAIAHFKSLGEPGVNCDADSGLDAAVAEYLKERG